MKKTITLCLLMVATFTINTYAQETKYGALAIDKNNGFYYGWAYDYNTLSEAENRALSECEKKGGNCHVVLEWSGAGCAAYRTINREYGTAYGWGLGKTREEADAIALKECMKRSNGNPALDYVWACNSGDQTPFKELYNDTNDKTATTANTNQTSVTESLVFNGRSIAATGECLDESIATMTTDDEEYFLVLNNLFSSGTRNVNANFYTDGCSDCLAIQFQDLNQGKTYVATSGTVMRTGNSILVNITVKELFDLINGTGQAYSITAKIVCEE